ncbi:YerC/YecD family TrpR-related protein [Pseudomonadota bacterium]
MTRWYNKKSESLFNSILALKNIDEAKKFFRDLLSEQELIEMSKRWQAAQMLDQNISYLKIQKATGLSSTTVARISKWLSRGKGGYRLMLDRLGHHRESTSLGRRLR